MPSISLVLVHLNISYLSFSTGRAVALSRSFFGRGRGIIWFDDIECIGNETSIIDCNHRGHGINNCFHSEDANVLCPGMLYNNIVHSTMSYMHMVDLVSSSPPVEDGICENGDVRLMNGTVENEGRVELCFNGRWGTICDDDWDNEDAEVVCTQMGLPGEGKNATCIVHVAINAQETCKVWHACSKKNQHHMVCSQSDCTVAIPNVNSV